MKQKAVSLKRPIKLTMINKTKKEKVKITSIQNKTENNLDEMDQLPKKCKLSNQVEICNLNIPIIIKLNP